MAQGRRTSRTTGILAGVLAFALVSACEPLTPVEPGSQLIDCSHANERVEITASSHLDPRCTYTKGFEITASGVTLDCRRALVQGVAGDGNRGIQVAAPEGVALSDVTVRNCRIERFLNSFRILREGYKTFAEGEEYEHPTSNILLENNTFKSSRGVGVYIDAYVEGVTLRDNIIDGAGSTGIYLETGSRRNIVDGNSLINNGYRENGPNGQPIKIGGADFWFWGVGREGIAVDGSYENTIRDNAFYGNSAGGIFLYKNCSEYPDSPRYFERRHHADRNLIEANTFVGGRNGIWVGSRMGENTLFMECTDPAYVEEPLRRITLDYAADNVVRANAFHDVTYGIRVEDDGTVVEDNTFRSSSADRHAVIIGTPYRTELLDHPVTGTVLRGNAADIPGNHYPYRWVHGLEATDAADNVALGASAPLCEGTPPPRQSILFVIAAAPAGPGGAPPATTPDLTVATLGALPPCAVP